MSDFIKYTVYIYKNGDKKWYLNGERHREDGPAIERADGTKEWWLNGNPHREDGPAVEDASGSKYWYLNGELHREDGPAVEYADGYKSWYLNGEGLTEEEFLAKTNIAKEMTVADIEKLLGHKVKIVKGE